VKLEWKRVSLLVVLVGIGLGVMLVAIANAQKVRVGNLIATIDGSVSPNKLSRTRPDPITLRLTGSLETTDGTHPPPVKELFLEFDRNGHLNTKGLATCRVGQLQSTLTTQARKICSDALIGQGSATAEIAFPEQPPFSASGPLLIFNGSHGNKQLLIIHVYAKVPAPTTFVTTALIGKGKGPYGTSARVRVPTITAGQGSVIGFRATIARPSPSGA
jgi:hypothetical protein